MIDAIDPAVISTIKSAFDTIRAGLGAATDVKDLLKDGPVKEAAKKKLAEAERATALAEAQLAQALGYKLCQCSFPPAIMLLKGRHPKRGIEIYNCPSCGNQVPSEHEFQRMDRNDAAIRDHNRGPKSWMGA